MQTNKRRLGCHFRYILHIMSRDCLYVFTANTYIFPDPCHQRLEEWSSQQNHLVKILGYPKENLSHIMHRIKLIQLKEDKARLHSSILSSTAQIWRSTCRGFNGQELYTFNIARLGFLCQH